MDKLSYVLVILCLLKPTTAKQRHKELDLQLNGMPDGSSKDPNRILEVFYYFEFDLCFIFQLGFLIFIFHIDLIKYKRKHLNMIL